MLHPTTLDSHTIDYFTYRPPTSDHFSTETPLFTPNITPEETTAIPSNPLLARRPSETPAALAMPSTSTPQPQSFLQMQTNASHGHTVRRPEPTPVQNVLHTTSDDSQSSADSSSSGSRVSSIELARCSRCHRTPSIDSRTGKNNMIGYGLNLWYCTRCAQMVGLGSR